MSLSPRVETATWQAKRVFSKYEVREFFLSFYIKMTLELVLSKNHAQCIWKKGLMYLGVQQFYFLLFQVALGMFLDA